AAIHEGLLYFGEPAVLRQSLHGVDLLTGRHGEKQQAAIHRPIGAACAVLLDHYDRAGAALAFRASFFRAGEALRAQEIKQRGWGRPPRGTDGAAIEEEIYAIGSRHSDHRYP